jgi:WD40 domain-containing protein
MQSASLSPDGRIVAAYHDGTVRVWDAASGTEIVVFRGQLLSASFSPDGGRIVTVSAHSAQVWDVARTHAIVRDRAVVMAAALAYGIGGRLDFETEDLLMQDAPEDMFAEVMSRLDARVDAVFELAATIRAPLHANCYLGPTQFAKRFGLKTNWS